MKIFQTMCISLIAFTALTMTHAEKYDYQKNGFDFIDCKGKPFNTKKIKDSDKSNQETDCYITGILNTKFDIDNKNKQFKSVKEMTEQERELFSNLTSSLDLKGLFAYSVYEFAAQTEEFKHLIEKN